MIVLLEHESRSLLDLRLSVVVWWGGNGLRGSVNREEAMRLPYTYKKGRRCSHRKRN